METGKLAVGKHDTCDFFGIARHKLDDVGRQTGFQKDGVYYPVRRDGRWRWFPHNNIPHQSRGTGEVPPDCCKVKGAHGIYETLEGSIFNTAKLG